jgi:hypothetical protein
MQIDQIDPEPVPPSASNHASVKWQTIGIRSAVQCPFRVKRRPSGAADLGLFIARQRTSEDCRSTFEMCRYCSLIPGLAVKLSTIILAGPTVLSAVGVNPPHDGVR